MWAIFAQAACNAVSEGLDKGSWEPDCEALDSAGARERAVYEYDTDFCQRLKVRSDEHLPRERCRLVRARDEGRRRVSAEAQPS